MKEKKLSKDGLMDEVMLAMNSAVATAHQQYPFREARITQAREQVKFLIESSAQEPNDAKLEEFLQRRTIVLTEAFHESNILHTLKETLAEYDALKEVEE